MATVAGRLDVSARGAAPLVLARWLALVAAMIAAIVVVGGITRLTESGVSITEWKPVSGILPPLTEAQWQAEFARYQAIPQYTQINGPAGMTLADYKFIFFWEWLHRLLARSVGVLVALPLAWFWIRGAIPQGFKPRLVGLLALGGLQGLVGWWMVKSGLVHDVKVSHLRLAVHLLLALTTLSFTLWTMLDMIGLAKGRDPARLTRFGAAALAVVAIQIAWGAFTAGMRAGYVAGAGWFSWDAWPLMQGRLVPDGIDPAPGLVRMVTGDPYLVHFVHRWWAWVVVAVLVVMARRVRSRFRPVSIALHTAFGIQILLGIATVWSGVSLWIAVLHQLGGACVLAATVWAAHALGRGPAPTLH